MRVRVVPHQENSANTYWLVEYKRGGFWSSWETLTKAMCGYSSLDLNERDFPVLSSFEEAKRIASSLNEAKLDEWIAAEDAKFLAAQKKLAQEIADIKSKAFEL